MPWSSTAGDLVPDGTRLGGCEQPQRDRVTGGRERGEDVIAIGALSPRRAGRGDGEGREAVCQETDGAIVTGVRVHGEAPSRKSGC